MDNYRRFLEPIIVRNSRSSDLLACVFSSNRSLTSHRNKFVKLEYLNYIKDCNRQKLCKKIIDRLPKTRYKRIFLNKFAAKTHRLFSVAVNNLYPSIRFHKQPLIAPYAMATVGQTTPIMPNTTHNETYCEPELLIVRWPLLAFISIHMNLMVIAVGVPCNALAYVVLLRDRSASTTRVFLLALAVADNLILLLVLFAFPLRSLYDVTNWPPLKTLGFAGPYIWALSNMAKFYQVSYVTLHYERHPVFFIFLTRLAEYFISSSSVGLYFNQNRVTIQNVFRMEY